MLSEMYEKRIVSTRKLFEELAAKDVGDSSVEAKPK